MKCIDCGTTDTEKVRKRACPNAALLRGERIVLDLCVPCLKKRMGEEAEKISGKTCPVCGTEVGHTPGGGLCIKLKGEYLRG